MRTWRRGRARRGVCRAAYGSKRRSHAQRRATRSSRAHIVAPTLPVDQDGRILTEVAWGTAVREQEAGKRAVARSADQKRLHDRRNCAPYNWNCTRKARGTVIALTTIEAGIAHAAQAPCAAAARAPRNDLMGNWRACGFFLQRLRRVACRTNEIGAPHAARSGAFQTLCRTGWPACRRARSEAAAGGGGARAGREREGPAASNCAPEGRLPTMVTSQH